MAERRYIQTDEDLRAVAEGRWPYGGMTPAEFTQLVAEVAAVAAEAALKLREAKDG